MRGRMHRIRCALVLLALAVTVGASANASVNASVPASRFEEATYIPAGIADSPGTIACVRTPEGGVEVLDLRRGKKLWGSPAPSRALLVSNGTVFLLEERGGRLRLSSYRDRTGQRVGGWTLQLDLPGWATLSERAQDRQWTTFATRARRDEYEIQVEYDARQFRVLGIAPGPNASAEAHGVVTLNPGSGRIERRPGERLEPIRFVERSAVGERAHLRFHARAADQTLMHGGPPPDVEGVLVAGDLRIAFEKAPRGRGLNVLRWSALTGIERPPLEIEADFDAIWPTLDRMYVALRRSRDQSRCDLYSLESGARILTLERPVDIAVVGSTVLATVLADRGISLVAREARTGRALWRRLVWREPPIGSPVP
jgi:hypothetical protein